MADVQPGPPPAAPDPSTRAPAGPFATGPTYNVRVVMAIWLVTGVIDVLIGIRFLLKALGASTLSSFTTFMYGISEPLVAPFRGIFPEAAHRTYVLEPADLIAIVIYALIGWALVMLVRIATTKRPRRTLE